MAVLASGFAVGGCVPAASVDSVAALLPAAAPAAPALVTLTPGSRSSPPSRRDIGTVSSTMARAGSAM
jgi:hypothetical protein